MVNSPYTAKKPDGNLITLCISIGKPELDTESKNGDYRCKVEVSELEFCTYSCGIDALQSFCMVIHCLKNFFEPLLSEGWKFYLPQDLEHDIDILSCYFAGIK